MNSGNSFGGGYAGARCVKCQISLLSWTTVNGHPCCDWCKPKDLKAENDRLWDVLENLVKSKAIQEAPMLGYSEAYLNAVQLVQTRPKQ
jgi:hypothetical protein